MTWRPVPGDLAARVCTPEIPVLEAMGRLERLSPHMFQVVVDADGRVVGSLTDGDIRRALLRGEGTNSPVSSVMNPSPRLGREGDQDGNKEAMETLARLRSHSAFLPIQDRDGKLCAILVLMGEFAEASALVMAGGKGRRLGERTRHTPKPLLKVSGKPMLEYVLDQVERAGIQRIFISVHHLHEQIRHYVEHRNSRAEITCVHEATMLGTAGAVALLPELGEGPLVVVNGDVLSDVNLQGMLDFHAHHGLDATIGAAHYEHEVPFGVIRHTDKGRFVRIEEKPKQRFYVSAGINVLAASIRDMVPRDRYMDMPNLLNSAAEAGMSIRLYPIHEYWTDLGRPADLDLARPPQRELEPEVGRVATLRWDS